MTHVSPSSLNEQILTLSKLTGQMRTTLQSVGANLPVGTLEELSSLESALFKVSRQIITVEEERRKLLGLANTTQAVNSSIELDHVLQLVMDTIIRLTEAERGFLMLRDTDGKITTRLARNWEQESISPNEFEVSRTIIERVIETGEAVLTTNAREGPRFGSQESIVAYNLRSILCVPLQAKTEMIGVIYADNRIRSGIFNEAERDLLKIFADQAAIAIENARLFASVRDTLDEVTGLKSLTDDFFSSIARGVITADVKEQVTLCNRAAEGILGQSRDEIIGRQLDDVLSTCAGDIRAHLLTLRDTDRSVMGLEITPCMPERGIVEWRLNLSPLKDADQITQGVAIVLDDMTERKKTGGTAPPA